MSDLNFPVQSKNTIIKASLFALVLSVIIYFVFVLPAEYGKDPIGTGQIFGLLALSDNESGSEDLPEEVGDNLSPDDKSLKGNSSDKVTLVVPAHSGIEYKFKMKKYSEIHYQWKTNGGELYFDFHGEPEGDTSGYFLSYSIATTDQMKGSMTVPFNGVHGWYWKNTTDNDIVVDLSTEGKYDVIGLMK